MGVGGTFQRSFVCLVHFAEQASRLEHTLLQAGSSTVCYKPARAQFATSRLEHSLIQAGSSTVCHKPARTQFDTSRLESLAHSEPARAHSSPVRRNLPATLQKKPRICIRSNIK